MKSNQKLSTLFWVRKSKATKDRRAPLYARISIDGKDEEISLERKVHVDHWDVKNKKDTEDCLEARETNLKMMEAEVILERHFTTLRALHDHVTPIMLKRAYNGDPAIPIIIEPIKVPDCYTILKAFQTFIDAFARQVKNGKRSEGTLRHWNTTRGKIFSFIKSKFSIPELGTIDMDIKQVNYEFAERLYEYLTAEEEKPLSEATAKTHIKKPGKS